MRVLKKKFNSWRYREVGLEEKGYFREEMIFLLLFLFLSKIIEVGELMIHLDIIDQSKTRHRYPRLSVFEF